MDDIVKQMRNECQCSDDCRAVGDPCICMRAADEIERLRNKVQDLRAYAEQGACEIERLNAEIARLGAFIHPIGMVVNREACGE